MREILDEDHESHSHSCGYLRGLGEGRRGVSEGLSESHSDEPKTRNEVSLADRARQRTRYPWGGGRAITVYNFVWKVGA